jgi:hypothetical protein
LRPPHSAASVQCRDPAAIRSLACSARSIASLPHLFSPTRSTSHFPLRCNGSTDSPGLPVCAGAVLSLTTGAILSSTTASPRTRWCGGRSCCPCRTLGVANPCAGGTRSVGVDVCAGCSTRATDAIDATDVADAIDATDAADAIDATDAADVGAKQVPLTIGVCFLCVRPPSIVAGLIYGGTCFAPTGSIAARRDPSRPGAIHRAPTGSIVLRRWPGGSSRPGGGRSGAGSTDQAHGRRYEPCPTAQSPCTCGAGADPAHSLGMLLRSLLLQPLAHRPGDRLAAAAHAQLVVDVRQVEAYSPLAD